MAILLGLILGLAAVLVPLPVCVESEPKEVTVTDYSWQVTMEPGKRSTEGAYRYEDSSIKITLDPQHDSFTLDNETITLEAINAHVINERDEPIKLIWDDSSIVHPDGTSGRITHSGVRCINVERSQPNSPIPSGAELSETIISTRALSSDCDNIGIDISDDRTVKLYLAFESGGQQLSYEFDFAYQRSSSTRTETRDECTEWQHRTIAQRLLSN